MNWIKRVLRKKAPATTGFERKIQDLTGYAPKNTAFYNLALRHSSASLKDNQGRRINNERLEFLGDAVLSSAVAHFLYQTFPESNEGHLTTLRSKIVSRKSLSKLSTRLELPQLVTNKIKSRTMPEHLPGNALEALVGALFLDHGFDAANHFIQKKIIATHIDLAKLQQEVISYKSAMIEWGQKNKQRVTFHLLDSWGESHEKTFRVELRIQNNPLAIGPGPSKKKAEEKAARKAMEEIKKNRHGQVGNP
jgi:ribonuclease-3